MNSLYRSVRSIPYFLLLAITLWQGTLIALPKWSYDPGPSIKEGSLGRELIDINADIPFFPGLSEKLMPRSLYQGNDKYSLKGTQKFRAPFGPIAWRMALGGENELGKGTERVGAKIIFMGQDGTHIAEASNRPATASFGGRAQDLAAHFGVVEGAAFLNTYAFTIYGQYGAYQHPYFYTDGAGTRLSSELNWEEFKKSMATTFVSNQLWLLTQEGPIAEWRDRVVDWLLRRNFDTVQMIVTFGGGPRDSIGEFMKRRGFKVDSHFSDEELAKIQIPESITMPGQQNKVFPAVLANDGGDFYQDLLGKRPNYKDENVQKQVVQALAKELAKANEKGPEAVQKFMDKLVLSRGGPYKNGLINSAQLGGYKLEKRVKGEKKPVPLSLYGLKLSDGRTFKRHVLVMELPHPSYLSRQTKEDASKMVDAALEGVAYYQEEREGVPAWGIKEDPSFEGKSRFSQGKGYKYGRSEIGPEYYDFGTAGTLMLSVSDASRVSPNRKIKKESFLSAKQAIVFGTRAKAVFNKAAVEKANKKNQDVAYFDIDTVKRIVDKKNNSPIPEGQMRTARARTPETRYVFDSGPGAELAELMITKLPPKSKLFDPKGEQTYEQWQKRWNEYARSRKKPRINGYYKDDNFNVKSHPILDDFGHYRGNLDSPKVLILADPDGYDDLESRRALSGTRGQYIHGLLERVGVKDNYAVIKTVPYGMDGANETEWNEVLKLTTEYRTAIVEAVLEKQPDLILSDGRYANREMKRILEQWENAPTHIEIERNAVNYGNRYEGLVDAAKEIRRVKGFEGPRISRVNAKDIPRSHLAYYARVWDGRGGDRVVNAEGDFAGLAFLVAVPRFAYEHKLLLKKKNAEAADKLVKKLEENGLPLPGEKIVDFLKRTEKRRKALEQKAQEDKAAWNEFRLFPAWKLAG